MVRYNLRGKVQEMDVDDVIKVPKGYEQTTIRNYASQVGKSLDRKFCVTKKDKAIFITRIS